MKINKIKLHEAEGVSEIIATTPYMLRTDGALLACDEAHPYIKMFFNDTPEQNIEELRNHVSALKWFYDNTLINDTKDLIINVLAKLDCADANDMLAELNVDRPNDGKSLSEDITALNEATNKEFCRVRTSNFKYKYGGDNGEIYFRLSDMSINWFDLIWKVVNRFSKSIKFITIMKDFATFGKQFDYCTIKGQPINKMPVGEFLTLPGNPRLETDNGRD